MSAMLPHHHMMTTHHRRRRCCRQYAASIPRPFDVHYDPYTQSVRVLDDAATLRDLARTAHGDLTRLQNALKRIDLLSVAH